MKGLFILLAFFSCAAFEVKREASKSSCITDANDQVVSEKPVEAHEKGAFLALIASTVGVAGNGLSYRHRSVVDQIDVSMGACVAT